MATSLKKSKKRHVSRKYKYLQFGEKKIVKIGPVDPEIICFNGSLKEKEINASKIYSPVGKFSKWAKLAGFSLTNKHSQTRMRQSGGTGCCHEKSSFFDDWRVSATK